MSENAEPEDEVTTEELLGLLDTGRDVRIPIRTPNPVTEADAERLYALTDECMVGSDRQGPFVEVEEEEGAVRRVLKAMKTAGFISVFHAALERESVGS